MTADAARYDGVGRLAVASGPDGAGRLGVGVAYAAQGLGYATVVTALPAFKQRFGIDDGAVTLIVLLVCLMAAGGSVLTERLSLRRGSAVALTLGIGVQAVAFAVVLLAVTSTLPLAALAVGFAIYGTGLGMVDAGAGIQGVLVERRLGSVVMSGFFACYTGAAIVGALGMALLRGAGSPGRASVAVAFALVAAVVAVVLVRGRLVPVDLSLATATHPGVEGGTADDVVARPPLPRRGIVLVGMLVLAAFVVDSAVSTWSTVLLADELAAGALVAPLGYAAYQAVVLVTRLTGDRVVRRAGRAAVVVAAALVAAAGLVVVALVPAPVAVVVGFAVAGVGVGVLAPAAFSAAGLLEPLRTDEVVSRVNLFNYAGAVLGAGVVGALAGGIGLATAFLAPAVLIAGAALVARTGALRG